MFSVYNELHTRDILPQWKCPKLASSDCQALEMGLVGLRKAIFQDIFKWSQVTSDITYHLSISSSRGMGSHCCQITGQLPVTSDILVKACNTESGKEIVQEKA